MNFSYWSKILSPTSFFAASAEAGSDLPPYSSTIWRGSIDKINETFIRCRDAIRSGLNNLLPAASEALDSSEAVYEIRQHAVLVRIANAVFELFSALGKLAKLGLKGVKAFSLKLVNLSLNFNLRQLALNIRDNQIALFAVQTPSSTPTVQITHVVHEIGPQFKAYLIWQEQQRQQMLAMMCICLAASSMQNNNHCRASLLPSSTSNLRLLTEEVD